MIWPEAEDRSPHNGRRGEEEGSHGEGDDVVRRPERAVVAVPQKKSQNVGTLCVTNIRTCRNLWQ